MLKRIFGRKRAPERPRDPWDLSSPLVEFSGGDVWTIGDSVEGTLVLGATGSGKTSGSGACIARAMLGAGYGGLVLTAKSDERTVWEKYCRDAGRLGDLLVFGPEQPLRFNFLDFELNRKGSGAGLTENIVNLFSTVLEVAERNSSGGGGGREDEGYWRRSLRQLVRNIVDLLAMAKGRISVPDMYRVCISAATSNEHVRSESWKAESFCYQCLAEADKNPKTAQQRQDFKMVADYLLLEYPALSDKTRSVIVSTFTSTADVLNRGVLRTLFCNDTNITPEAAELGKIILIDLPVKEFADVGKFAQLLWKNAFQKAIERRDVSTSPRPVFLWSDEAQTLVTSYDMQFQTTCRAARVATVLLSQNVSNFYAALGGNEKGKAEASSLFACLNTKILHGNGDPVTNEWGSSLVGQTLQCFANGNNSYSSEDWVGRLTGFGAGARQQTTGGFSESYQLELQPAEFTSLRTGGPANGWNVDAIVFQNGKRFRGSGRTWLRVSFRQTP